MLDFDAFLELAAVQSGRQISREAAALPFVEVNQAAIRAGHAARVRWERWDQKTPINNVSAEHILGRGDHKGGPIYLVYIDEELSLFQPYDFRTGDPIPEEDLSEAAQAHVDSIVDDFTNTDVVIAVLTSMTTEPTDGIR